MKEKGRDSTRIDLRIPSKIYEEIEAIAKETNQPLNPKSKKPIVTPIIVNLLKYALENRGGNYSGLDLKPRELELERRLTLKLNQEIEALERRLKNTQTDIVSDKKNNIMPDTQPDNNSDILSDTAQIEDGLLGEQVLAPYEKAVEEIGRLRQQGLGFRQIAKALSGKYYTKRGKPKWNHTVVADILRKK